MDRDTILRTVVAGVLIIAVIYLVSHFGPTIETYISPPKPAAKAPPQEEAAKVPATEKSPATAKAPPEKTPPEKTPPEKTPPVVKAPALQVVGAGEEAAAKPLLLGSDKYEDNFDLFAEVTARGAAVQRLALSRRDFFRTVQDQYLPPDERQPMDLITPPEPGSKTSAPPAFAIPELRVRLKGAEEWAKLDLSQTVWRPLDAECSQTQAVLAVDVNDGDGKPLLTVRKTFRLLPRAAATEAGGQVAPQYEMHLVVDIAAADDRVEKVAYVLAGSPALPVEAGRGAIPMAVAGSWAPGGTVQMTAVSAKDIKKNEELPATTSLGSADLAWVGEMDKYFAVVLIPQKPSPQGTFAAGAETAWFRVVNPVPDAPDTAMPGAHLVSREREMAPGKPVADECLVYAGPKDQGILQTYYSHLGLQNLIQWSSPCCFFPLPGIEYISRFLVLLLDAFHSVVLNYGVAIILLVILLRVVLHPITRWSTKSMAEMQKLAPKMQKIREEFGHDKERMQQEMAKIGGFKAFGGCLPMFLQMPIWVALYGALGAAIELRHAPFIPPGWLPAGSMFLQDLSAPDMLVHWTAPFFLPGRDIPLLGWLIGAVQGMLGPAGITSFNLLPLLVGASMYLQQKITPQPVATTPQAEQQRKMMNYMMIFFAAMLYNLPSGLCLYISASSFLGFFEQRYLRKKLGFGMPGAAPPDETPKESKEPKAPPPPAKPKSFVSGREKSISERVETWVKKHLQAPEREDDRKGKGKKGR